MSLQEYIQDQARQIGFTLCGFTTDFQPRKKKYFLDWLETKKFAQMEWLGKNTDKRLQPNLILEDTKSVVVLAVSYNHEPQQKDYKMARYAHGEDYHRWMKKMLEELAEKIHKKESSFLWRSFVDTGPILERDLATKAGLGWIGKNTCLLNEEHGSYLFLGVILSNLEFQSFTPPLNQCGNCRFCIEACPTDALTPYQMDPQKCLAYQNIEKRGERDEEIVKNMGDWLVGCDICQEVCPWNEKAPKTKQESWIKTFADFDLGSLEDIEKLDEKTYKKKIKNSAILRIKHDDMMRNVAIVKKV